MILELLKPVFFKDIADGSADAAKGMGKLVSVFKSLNPVGIAATAVFGLLLTAFTQLAQVSDDVAKKARDVTQQLASEEKEFINYQKEIAKLQEIESDSSSTIEEVTEARKSLLAIQNEITDKYGAEALSVDLLTTKLEDQTAAWEALAKARWKAAQKDFNNGGFWNDVDNWLLGYEDNEERMLAEYTNKDIGFDSALLKGVNFDDKIETDLEQKIESILKSKGFTVEGKGTGNSSIHITGTADEIYDAVDALKEAIPKDTEFYTDGLYEVLNSISDQAEELKDKYEDYFNQYILNEEILSDSIYKDHYKKLIEAQAEYDKARISGDEKAIDSAKETYAKVYSEAIAAADNDQYVLDYFKDMYPELSKIVGEWQFAIYFKANPEGIADGIKNALQRDSNEIDELKQKYKDLKQTREDTYSGSNYVGNVDINNRPVLINSDGSYSTTSTAFQEKWIGDEETGSYKIIHYTPILPDGTVLEGDALNQYIDNILSASDSLYADDPKNGGYGIVYKVDTEVNGEKITDGNLEDAFKQAGAWDVQMHETQDAMYANEAAALKEYNEALKNQQYTVEEILAIDPKTAVGKQLEVYEALYAIAKDYGMEVADLVWQLNELGVIDTMSHRQLVNAFGEEKVSTLTKDQLKIAYTLSPADYNSWEEYVKEINRQLQAQIHVSFNFDKEAENFENIRKAFEESLNGTGLTPESIKNIKDLYSQVDGYDEAELFKNTAHGVQLNVEALERLQEKYAQAQETEIAKKLHALEEQYEDLTDKIEKYGDADGKNKEKLKALKSEIEETKQLAAGYKGLNSAYNKWQKSKEAPNYRDTYEGLAAEMETIIGELERGILDVDTMDFLSMLSGQVIENVDDAYSAIQQLGKKLDGTDFSAFDFIHLNKDGEVDKEGVDNFFKAVEQALGKEYAFTDENGLFHFNIPSVNELAEKLGIGAEYAQIILDAAKDFGYVVNTTHDITANGLPDTLNEENPANVAAKLDIDTTSITLLDEATKENPVQLHAQLVLDGSMGGRTLDTSVRRFEPNQAIHGTSGLALADGNVKGKALGGELGPELRVRDGEFSLIGQDGAEFFDYKNGDIIFNAEQTEELLENGKLSGGNVRGKAFAKGNLPQIPKIATNADGEYSSEVIVDLQTKINVEANNPDLIADAAAEGIGHDSQAILDVFKAFFGGWGSSNVASGDEFEEDFDWIEVAISRIERTITNLGKTVSATYKTWSTRNSALDEELQMVSSEIDLQQKAYDKYMSLANSVGLSDNYKKLVQSGAIDYETITDESLAEKIQEYQDFYEKALACEDTIIDLKDELANLAKTKFDNVAAEYEAQLSLIEHEISMLDSYINQVETRGYFVSTTYYKELMKTEQDNISTLEKEYESLQNALAEAMAAGNIEMYSEDWYDMQGAINEVEQAIVDANTALIEYKNSMREIEWEMFDTLQEMLSEIQAESDFFIELMSKDKLITETGSFTDQGNSTLGLHVVNYGAYMSQAADYAKELEKVNAELANDPNNLTLLERRQELLDSQREMILAAEDEKQAMYDLVEEAYQTLLDYIGEVIDKRKELLQTTKDLYDYEKNVAEQTKEIARLEKILSSYQGDDSEEAKASIQEYKVQLQEAKENLEETEYEQYLSDQEQMLDTIYDEMEQWINERLDNLELIVQEVIDSTNANAETINTTLHTEAEAVGYTISDKMDSIFSSTGTFTSVLNNTNAILDSIRNYVASMVDASNRQASETISGSNSGSSGSSSSTSSSENLSPSNSNNSSDNSTRNTGFFVYEKFKGNKSNLNINTSITDRLKYNDFASSFSHRASYYESMGLGSASSYTGSSSQNSAMRKWMQANGFSKGGTIGGLIKSSGEDGFVLARSGESIINEAQMKALRETFVALKPVVEGFKYIRPELISNSAREVKNNVEMNITLPNVTNYEQFKYALQHDKSFEKTIQHMTLGAMTGKNSLGKYKYQ